MSYHTREHKYLIFFISLSELYIPLWIPMKSFFRPKISAIMLLFCTIVVNIIVYHFLIFLLQILFQNYSAMLYKIDTEIYITYYVMNIYLHSLNYWQLNFNGISFKFKKDNFLLRILNFWWKFQWNYFFACFLTLSSVINSYLCMNSLECIAIEFYLFSKKKDF